MVICGAKRIIALTVTLMLLSLHFYVFQPSGEDRTRVEVISTPPLPLRAGPRADTGTIVLFDDFENGLGNFSLWNDGAAQSSVDTQYDGDSRAFDGNSVFFWGTGENREIVKVAIETTLNLSQTNEVSLALNWAFEDMEVSGNTYDLFSLDFDTDGNTENGYSHQRWHRFPVQNNDDHTTSPNDYARAKFDISWIPKRSDIRMRFTAQFRRWYSWSYNDDLIALDNITVSANYLPSIIGSSLNITPQEVYTLTNDTSVVNFTFRDRDDHLPETFSLSVDFRLSDGMTQLRYLENASSAHPQLSVINSGRELFDISIDFDPDEEYGFGRVDIRLFVFDEDGLVATMGYDSIPDAIDLKNYIPVINSSSIHAELPGINVLNPSLQSIRGTWTDLDNQSVSDYRYTIRIRDTQNTTHTLAENITHGTAGFTVDLPGNGEYVFCYEWLPNASFVPSLYDVLVEIDDGNGGHDNTTFIENPGIFELFTASISDVSASPSRFNRKNGPPVHINFTVSQNATGAVDLRYADMNISLRGGNGTEYVLYPGIRRGNEPEIINLTENSFRVSYSLSDAAALPVDEFDLAISISENDMVIDSSGYEENPAIFTVFNNTAPVIVAVSASPPLLNTYYGDMLTIKVSFNDADDPLPELFTANLSVLPPSGNALYLYPTAVGIEREFRVTRLGQGTYTAEFAFPAMDTFEIGKYDVNVSVSDALGTRTRSGFAANANAFELYFNEPPEPPDTLFPSETRERSPLIHWYGATDATTSSQELEYYIRIGTSPGTGNILEWHSVGRNPFYQVEDPLDYETYHVEVMSSDGLDNSTPVSGIMDLFALANLPPTPPNQILPDYTIEALPRITWSGAYDDDGDPIKNSFIQIGTDSYGNDTLSWKDVGASEQYQVRDALPFGTYYVQVRVSDGKALSYVHQELMHIIGEGNAPPSPPTEMYPTSTWDLTPEISWVGAYDIDGDRLLYSIRIGSGSGEGDVLPWVEGLSEERYQIGSELPLGKYYVQIRAFDGDLYSVTFEALLEITEVGNIPPLAVSNITPSRTTNSTPLISWMPSTDPDGDDGQITYFIQIGLSRGHGEILSWYSTKNQTKYPVSNKLSPNRVYHIQIKAFDGKSHSPVAYATLEVIVYITEISFDDETLVTVQKGEEYIFDIRVVNRGTVPDEVTIRLDVPKELAPHLNLSATSAKVQPEGIFIFTITIFIPDSSSIIGEYNVSAECTSQDPDFHSRTTQDLRLRIVRGEEPSKLLYERVLEENLAFILAAAGILVLLLMLLVVVLVMRSRKNRIPTELLDREKDFRDAPEVTYSPNMTVGVVAKTILPDASGVIRKKVREPSLPLKEHPANPQLPPSSKKRLALPQYSVVIDMNTKQVVGHTETREAGIDDGEVEEEGDILNFELKDGKYEIATPGVPSAHPYGKASPASVPSEHMYGGPIPGVPKNGPPGNMNVGDTTPGSARSPAAIKGYKHKERKAGSGPVSKNTQPSPPPGASPPPGVPEEMPPPPGNYNVS